MPPVKRSELGLIYFTVLFEQFGKGCLLAQVQTLLTASDVYFNNV